ncbi:MAG: type III pantothenate kinase [Thermodesulfovibrionales bacterium]
MKKHKNAQQMLLAADIGNSTITVGYFRRNKLVVHRMPTHPLRKPASYCAEMDGYLKEKLVAKRNFPCIISSVVPGHTGVFRKALSLLTGTAEKKILLVDSGMKTGLVYRVGLPERLGTDRIANAAAAWALCRRPVAVVDFGTATTITVVGRAAVLLGGAILPGVGMMSRMLAQGTSRLPQVPLELPAAALGTDTVSSIQAGIFYGTAGAVERILEGIRSETGTALKVLVTGGHGPAMSACLRVRHDLRNELTLEGLRILYENNRPA